jgi:Ca-activated chloride channel family protein
MRLVISKQVIEARIKKREQARRQFEQAKQAGKSASLLEEQRPNVFTMNVANVMPHDQIHVTLRYTELLVPTSGVYEFAYPTVVGPRYSSQTAASAPSTDQFVASPYLPQGSTSITRFELSGTLSTAVPIQRLSSPSHQLVQKPDNAQLIRFSLPDSERRNNSRDFILRYRLSGDAIQSGLSLYDAGGEKFFLLMVQPPKQVVPKDVPPREYVFVVDVSGSMYGFPLDTAKTLLRTLIGGLRPVDKFNVLLFSGGSYLLSPQSLPGTSDNVNQAISILDSQQGGGGTELLPALERALGLSAEPGLSRSFVIVTDGYIAADRRVIQYVRANLGRANVFSFGIGTSVNRYLIEGMAKAGMGEPFVVTSESEAPAAVARFQQYVSLPVLTDVRVNYDGFDVHSVEPGAVPDVLAERPVVVFGKWRGKPRGSITVSGVSGAGPYSQRFDAGLVAPRAENQALRYLWARSRIASLHDFAFGEPTEAEKQTITQLGLTYSLLSPYTSFIAVSRMVRNPSGQASDVEQPLPLPVGVSDHAVGTSPIYGAPEPELVTLLLGLALLLAAGWMLPLRRQGGLCP